MHNANETILEVDLNKLEHNYNYLSSKLKKGCKIIAVVKAYAYGHGDIEISKKLERLGVYAFWVADFEEGIRLRESGIKSKIIIANPGWKSFNEIIKYDLEVVIHNIRLLDFYLSKKQEVNIHLKFNTGMNRYGFDEKDLESICEKLKKNSFLKIQTLCSHLASAEDASQKNNTQKQVLLFEKISERIENKLEIDIPKHLLNSNGFINFPSKQFDMVRLGISLFGTFEDENLQQISRLVSVISQNRIIVKGEGVGYSASYIASKKMNISVIPVGYADGLNRKLGNGIGEVIVKGVKCPIIGKICMDSFMIDSSGLDCKEGEEVEIFGKENSILCLSKKIDTIPYEIYSTLNRRIKRIYIDS